MRSANRISRGAAAALTFAFIVTLTMARPAQGQTESVIYDFCSLPNCADGYAPTSNLIMDSQGNMYSTTIYGGVNSSGTVFKLSGGTPTVLYTFCSVGGINTCTDGSYPTSGLLMDSAGNLYGTTSQGGAHGVGTVFKLSSDGNLTTLHSFNNVGTDGYGPDAGVAMDAKGNLYGTTFQGGKYGSGVVYRIAPNGAEAVLHSFGNSTDAADPAHVVLVSDKQGNFYGTTLYGGTHGAGTVFKITPAGVESVLYSFGASKKDGAYPSAGLTIDPRGNLYGTTVSGGKYNTGTVFAVTHTGTGVILHNFQNNGTDGYNPYAPMIRDSLGNLYGVTYSGGSTQGCSNGCGTVFKISTSGVETILHDFVGNGTDGINPQGSLVMDSQGNLYGTTFTGGVGNLGTVFEITP